MSYASTAQTGSIGRQSSSGGFGKRVGAAVLTVAVGLAIAAGIAFNSSDVSSTSSESADADRVLLGKSTVTDMSTDADMVLRGKASTVATNDWSMPVTYDDLVEQGYIPTPHQPTQFTESPGQPR